jgi:hypothetical protein
VFVGFPTTHKAILRKEALVLKVFFSKVRGFFLFSCLTLLSLSYAQAEKIPEVPGAKFSSEKLDLARQIRALFPNTPIMMRVAMCESGLVHMENGDLKRGYADGLDAGVFQVRLPVHGREMRRLGLDPYRLDEYLAYVRHLYDTQGLRPWKSSRHCWNRNTTTPPRG